MLRIILKDKFESLGRQTKLPEDLWFSMMNHAKLEGLSGELAEVVNYEERLLFRENLS